ncbi:DUF6973 domain-containing protein [Methylobacter sp.]|uniref:DUF6973 domain-containing protein n=1 Tax=Methylobacter sp. TaxID=2051955 RepID=UPI002FDC947D
MSEFIADALTTILGTNITSPGDSAAIANSLGGFPVTTGYRNDAYDAFRHAYGSALLSEHSSDAISKLGMDYHEATHRDPDPVIAATEENMDKFNNNVGREEYHRWQDAKDTGQTTDSLEKWIYDRVNEGKTINNPLDPNEARKWSEPSTWDNIKNTINDTFTKSQTFVPPPVRRDPLVLDLNNNGIETVGINTASPILFDQNADGVKTATGWINANDGLLVWDRNGNGTIDNGRELFGDSTIKSDGSLATGGFNALADLDSNHDGIVNAQDTDFAGLRVWRDLNQDGISQSNELSTLK